MANLYVQLSGGLGNQMFQYATARAVALVHKLELKLDERSGFARDKQYKRKFALNALEISGTPVGNIEGLPAWLHRIQNKLFGPKAGLYHRHWYGDFFAEQVWRYHDILISTDYTRNTWLIGYWQSYKYFQAYESLLQHELMPQEPKSQSFMDLAANIQQSESVALGVRLYEETKNPGAHALHEKVKSITEINLAIRSLRKARPTARFFVFCTHRSPELRQLELPADATFVLPEEGFSDAVDCLWLLTRCKHHIFTNSSYYWWGAWLSHAVHKKEEQLIYAADNFINVDGLCDHWQRF